MYACACTPAYIHVRTHVVFTRTNLYGNIKQLSYNYRCATCIIIIMHSCMHICTYIYIYTCMHIYIHIYIYIYMCVCVFGCACKSINN